MRALVTGAGGFIGGHLVKRLEDEGWEVFGADVKPLHEWWQPGEGQAFVGWDLSDELNCLSAVARSEPDVVFNLAADMGGMGFIAGHKAECMLSVKISVGMLEAARRMDVPRFFYASSACVYPGFLQEGHAHAPNRAVQLREEDAYPADPEDGYGWEKLFSERMGRHFAEDFGLDFRTARYHNVYGPYGTWQGGREKAPAAMCRKVATAKILGEREIEVWGDGTARRSYMFVDDCVEGTLRITGAEPDEYYGPMNLGSEEDVSVDELARLVMHVAAYETDIAHVPGPVGVQSRNSQNDVLRATTGWEPSVALVDGIAETYAWVEEQVSASLW